MTILNFNETYSTVADDTSGVVYFYTIDSEGNKCTHRVSFTQDLSKTMSELTKPSGRQNRKIYENDKHIMSSWNRKTYRKINVGVFPLENCPKGSTILAKRIKKAIYTYQQSPVASYNRMAIANGWELLQSIDEDNTEYITPTSETITEVKPLRIKLPKFSLAEENERLNEQVSTLMVQLATLREEQSKQASLLQQMFLLLSTWFATLGGVPKRT